MMANEELETVAQLFYEALKQVMQHIDTTRMLALWSEQDDVTYCDPGNHLHQGREALVRYWQRAASLKSGSPGAISAIAEPATLHSSGNLLCTVMVEHVQIKEKDTVKQHIGLATNIYRYEGGRWRMVHRHSGLLRDEEEADLF